LGIRQALRTPGIRTFLIIWSGQVISSVGSGLTSFALRKPAIARFADPALLTERL
jgi:hypothetical protein